MSFRFWLIPLCSLLVFGFWLGRPAQAQEITLKTLVGPRPGDLKPPSGQELPAGGEDLRALGWWAEMQGDCNLLALAWGRYVARYPAQGQATAVWLLMARQPWMQCFPEQWEAAARAVLAEDRADPILRASARVTLAQLTRDREGRRVEVPGYISAWRILGPFDNVANSGFLKALPPEQGTPLNQPCTGKNDRPLRWAKLPGVDAFGRCLVAAALGPGDGEVYYALTAVQGPAGAATLRLDPSGACQVWLDGQCVFRRSTYGSSTDYAADMYAVPVTLKPGWNSLLVKVASEARDDEADFTLRLTEVDSDHELPVQVDPEQARSVVCEASQREDLPAALRSLPAELDGPLLKAGELASAGATALALEQVQQLAGRYPDSAWLTYQLAVALEDDDQDDAARQARKKALAADPGLGLAAMAESLDATADPRAGVQVLRTLISAHPNNITARLLLSVRLMRCGLASDAQAELEAATQRWPEGVLFNTAVRLLQQDQSAVARSLLSKGLQRFPGDPALRLRAYAMDSGQGRHSEAVEDLQTLIRLEPIGYYYRALAEEFTHLKQLDKAESALRSALDWRPGDAALAVQLGDLLHERGQDDQALALYQQAMHLEPGRVGLRGKVQMLKGETSELDLIPPLADADPATADLSAVPDASSVFLVDDGRVVLYPDFARIHDFHLMVKVLDESGVKQYTNYPMGPLSATSRLTVEIARLHKADGKVQDVRDVVRGWVARFPSLAVGDTLELRYKVEDSPEGGLAHSFWTSWSFNGSATLGSRFAVISPKNQALHAKTVGQPVDFQQRDQGQWTIREWRCGPRPAAKGEVRDRLDLSTIGDWSQVARWYYDLSRPLCQPDERVTAKALALTQGATTETDKVSRLQAYVCRDIEYQSNPFRNSAFIPTPGKQVLEDGFGDCKDKSALLCAMLKAVGLQADMVLLNTRNQGFDVPLPSPRFNHAIVRIHTSKGMLYVDPTDKNGDLLTLPLNDQGVMSLLVAPDTKDLSLIPLAPVQSSISAVRSTGRLSTTGSLDGKFEMSHTGAVAGRLRSLIGRVATSQQQSILHEVLASLLGAQAVPGPCRIEGLDQADAPLRFNFSFKAEKFARPAGGYLMMPVPWGFSVDLGGLYGLREQPRDIDLIGDRGATRLEVDLELPAGFRAELPPKRQREGPFGKYSVDYTLEKSHLRARATISLDYALVKSADNLALLKWLEQLSGDLSEPLLLKRGS